MSDEVAQAVEEQPAIAEQSPAVAVPATPVVVDEDAALDAQLEEQTIDLPEGEKLVPLSAVTTVREKLKTVKADAAKVPTLEAELAKLRGEMDEAKPWIEAAKTIAATRQMQPEPPKPAAPDPEVQAELTDLARTLDLYKTDGTLDLDKAQKIHNYNRKIAEQVAQTTVAPVRQHALNQQAGIMYQRALETVATDGSKPDPSILRDVFARLDPRLTATEEGAREAWVAAMGRSAAAGRIVKATTAAPVVKPDIPAPLLTERAGGKDEPNRAPLSEMEKRAIKQMGMTEKEYLEADKRPWRR